MPLCIADTAKSEIASGSCAHRGPASPTGCTPPACYSRLWPDLPDWKKARNKSYKQVRARVEHASARMKAWKTLRDCPLRGDDVRQTMHGVARLHTLALTG